MSETDWTRVDALFAAVLEQPPERRTSFLADATTGDDALRRRVMSLLEAVDEAEGAIGESADQLVSAPVLEEPPDDLLPPGTRLGAYEVREEIGRGGMGRVYLGVRADATFDRNVAIKVVARSVASELVLRRFAAERRILASLEHPNIARLYDAGVAADGRPYLVMEHIGGSRIDRYVADQRSSLDERLGLFEQVCDAVSFAHQRLVIHRDLKPANILVTADRRVGLLDFGIARLVSEESESTRAGLRHLTPEYAAPEQLAGGAASVAMDVYSLGIVLHELLTGARPPWQRLLRDGANADAIERAMILPSVSSRTSESSTVVPPVSTRQLRGDLDTVVMTALALEPARRYASVEALRDDVRRVRTGFPITARPAPWRARARKFVQRNAALSAAAALSAVLAVGYVATVFVQSRRITAERDRATVQGTRADQVARVLVDLFGASDPFAPGRQDTVRVGDFLQAGAARVETDLANQPVVLGSLLTVLGRAQRRLGRNDDARVVLQRAEQRLRDSVASAPEALADVLHELGQLAQSETRRDDAERYYRESLALVEMAPATPPAKLVNALLPVGTMLMFRGSLDSARAYFDSAAATLDRMPVPDSALLASYLNVRGDYHYRRREPAEGVTLMERAAAIERARLGPDHARTLLLEGNVAFALTTVGRNREAIDLYRETLERLRRRLGLGHPTVVEQLRTMAAALSREGRVPEAEAAMREAVAGARLLGASSTDLAETLDAFGQFMERVNRPREAEPAYREALAINRRVYGEGHPVVAIVRARIASVRCQRPEGSAADERELRDAVRGVDAHFPEGEPVRMKVHSDLGLCLARRGDVVAARAELESNFEVAVKGRGAAHPMVQLVGRALRGFYDSQGDSAASARVGAVLTPVAPPSSPR